MSGREASTASTEGDFKGRVNKLVLEAVEKGDLQRAAALKRVLAEDQQAGCGAGCPCGPPGSGCTAALPKVGENVIR